MRARSWLAKGTMLETVLSKSKSKPSITALPNGRGELLPATLGPKMDQMFVAAAVAAAVEENPPSVYVAPPIERRMVLP
jgi:hypothetical protein